MEHISSRRNPIVQQFRALAAQPKDGLLLDGVHLLAEALAAGVPVDIVALGERVAGGPDAGVVRRAEEQGARILTVSDEVLAAISPVREPSGVVAIARRCEAALEDALADPPQLVLLLADVQDPGNVGAIIRTADACGATGVVTGERTAEPFQWKALRGSMGSIFRLPVVTRQPIEAAAAAVRQRGIRLLATVPREGTLLPRCDLRGPIGVLLGGEGSGLPPHLLALADERISIPMRPAVESLNVATAAALVVYEAMRQRQGTSP